jgi:HAD superfamily hydrolase (TIGR01509 family)
MGTEAAAGGSGVVFDIDGTLLDSNYLHVVAWSAAFCDNGFRVEMADIHRAIGLPSEALVQRLVQQQRADLVDAHSEHFQRLREKYGVNAMSGAADLLQRCAESGWTVTLATSGGKSDLDWMLPLIGASDVIAGATTSEDVREGKPRPDVMLAAMEAHGLVPERTIAIGDSVWDVQAAARAGIPCIGLSGGGIGRFELHHAGAVEVYDDAADLADRFAVSLLGRRAPAEN